MCCEKLGTDDFMWLDVFEYHRVWFDVVTPGALLEIEMMSDVCSVHMFFSSRISCKGDCLLSMRIKLIVSGRVVDIIFSRSLCLECMKYLRSCSSLGLCGLPYL